MNSARVNVRTYVVSIVHVRTWGTGTGPTLALIFEASPYHPVKTCVDTTLFICSADKRLRIFPQAHNQNTNGNYVRTRVHVQTYILALPSTATDITMLRRTQFPTRRCVRTYVRTFKRPKATDVKLHASAIKTRPKASNIVQRPLCP